MNKIGFDLLDALLQRLCVTEQGVELVRKIRDGAPLEPKPRVRIGRMRGEHISSLMGFAVRLNDATLQEALLHDLDDPRSKCIEYYSWPIDIGGIRYGVSHDTRTQVDVFRPFLFKISEDWIGFVDAFPTSMLRNSVRAGSALYYEVAPGHWTSPPLAERLLQYGFRYQILTEQYFGSWYLLNMGILSSYCQPSYKIQNPAACDTVVAMVNNKGYMFRRELIDNFIISADDLNYLIATRRLFFPIKSRDVTDIRTSAVFRDEVAFESFKAAKAANDGFLSLEKIDGESSSKSDPDFINFISPEAFVYARHKMATLCERVSYWWPGSGPKREGKIICPETKALWKSQAELGELLYNNEVFGLIPRWHSRGCRELRFPESEKLWDHVYMKYRLLKRYTIRATHGVFVAVAKRLHLPYFSEETAKARDREGDKSIFVKFRDGSAARYSIAGFSPPGVANRLYQVTVPFILAYVDHTPLKIRIENSANGRIIKSQVWLSAMVDAATGRKLAWTISFCAPSAVAVTTVLFECIDKHGCLPLFIVVDNAPEFESLVMHRILQEAETHLLWRVPYHPRYGSPIEAANNKITVQTLQLLTGNTVAIKNLYDYSRTFIARNPELMTLTQLSACLKGVFDEVELEVGSARTGDEPVKDYEARKKEEVGLKYRKRIELTLAFRRLCMPPASNEGLRVVRDEGYVVANNLAFFAEGLKRFRGQKVRVFPDVLHPGIVYVYVGKDHGWFDAKSIFADFFSLYSKRELSGVIAELKHGKLHGVRDPSLISRMLAEKILELECDPKRKDILALQMDRLMNRAPSLLKTEPDSENYFDPPPFHFDAASSGTKPGNETRQTAGDSPAPNVDTSIVCETASQEEHVVQEAASASNAGPVSGNASSPSSATGKEDDFNIIVRPSKLSFSPKVVLRRISCQSQIFLLCFNN